ncbi:MAG: type II toxin-antitoxin system RelE/ParE family toxin [Mariniphaga sp.]|nr:type II toxin-antitoxin system RelE/ParE family toxin [Mariniphaga sp.]
MAYSIIIDPVANLDIIDYIDWYNKAQPGLGIKFYKQVQVVIKSLQKNPFAFSIRYKDSHTALVKKFPYMVHYFVVKENSIVVVTSVLHTSRDPKIWIERNIKR